MEKSSEEKLQMKQFWIRLWKLLSPSHKLIFRLLLLTAILELIYLSGPYVLKLIIDLVADFNPDQLFHIAALVILMFAINQTASIISYFEDRRIFGILIESEKYLSQSAHRKMVFLSLNYHEKENTGNKIIKIQRGVDKINDLLANFFWEVSPTVMQLVFTTASLFFVDWRFGTVILFFAPLFVFQTVRVSRQVYPMRKIRYDKQEEAAGMMAQAIININTVKSFVQEERENNQYGSLRNKIKKILWREWGKILKHNIGRNFIIDAGRALILLFGIFLIWQGQITVGSLVFVYTVSEKALISLFRISRLYDRIMESGEAVQRLYDLSLEKSEIKNPKQGIIPKQINGKIELKNVSYAYKESGIKALDNVSLKIGEGCVTALVGPSGGGKTTLARMVYRHYDPDSGKILLDGSDLRKYDLYGFRKFFAIVPQEVEVFNSSVKENIAYAKPDAGFEEIVAAAKIANVDDFVKNFKDGYDTLVGERGMKLSGGQRQRLGIARAILANPKVLIFDEATSNLDSQSERLIQQALEKIGKGRTVIIIAHRLSTIRKADKIIVLEGGRVVEQGSHLQLAQTKGGLYQKLLNLQRMGDVE